MKIKRKPVMAASGAVEFTNEIDAIYNALKNLEFNTPEAAMFVDVVRKPRYAVRVETERTLEDGNTIADETFYIFKSDDGRIKAVFEDQNPRVFIDTDAVVTFIRDYWRDRGFDLTSGVDASTKSRASSVMATKRPIKASEFGSLSLSHAHDYDEKYSAPAKRVEMTFPYFLQDIEDSIKEDSYDFSVNGTTLYDNDDYIELEVIPTYAGAQLDTERVVIRFDANESPAFVAEYDNGYQFASGDSFSSILVEVTQSIRESLIEYVNNYDENYEEE